MAETKAEVRARVRAWMKGSDPAALRASDDALFERFLTLPELARAETVLLFHGMGAEPDTARLIAPLLDLGKTVALPRCMPERAMEARTVTAAAVLVRHRYGMLEPGEDCPLLSKDKIELILVPGLAFDKNGYRLGQGGGYYDRYLENFTGHTAALCRDALLMDAVPREAHDRPVELVVTERRILRRV